MEGIVKIVLESLRRRTPLKEERRVTENKDGGSLISRFI